MTKLAFLPRAIRTALLVVLVSACAGAPLDTPALTVGRTAVTSPAATPAVTPTPTPVPSFSVQATAKQVLAAYRDEAGFICEDRRPSDYLGFDKTVCRSESAGIVRRITLITTEEDGVLVGGWASVVNVDSKPVEPDVAVTHLEDFLAAMLGPDRSVAVIDWLHGNIGAEYEESEIALGLKVATYVGDSADDSQVFVEIAANDYLMASKRV